MRFENLEQIDSTKTRHIGAKNESKNQYKHIYPYDETLGTLTLSNLKVAAIESGAIEHHQNFQFLCQLENISTQAILNSMASHILLLKVQNQTPSMIFGNL